MIVKDILCAIEALPSEQRWSVLQGVRRLAELGISTSFKEGMEQIKRGEGIDLDDVSLLLALFPRPTRPCPAGHLVQGTLDGALCRQGFKLHGHGADQRHALLVPGLRHRRRRAQ
jgi:hypothetical protein